jgi:poly-gamma-glutamate synthesis protein (capsule biosynthesis protein)
MYGGLFKTIEYLDAAGVYHAGTGKDLAEARQPVYMDTPKGRVALIAAAAEFAYFDRAGAARRDMRGRPGLNPLRHDSWYEVKEETFETLKKLKKDLGLPEVVQLEGAYYFLQNKFVVGSDVGVHTKPNNADMEGNFESIREAVRQADWVLFSLHASSLRRYNSEQPAEFLEEFARACIDNGVHAFIGHGPHKVRGIEIRDGKPIFYSLGNYIFQNETVSKMPADFYERYKLDPYKGTPTDAYDARRLRASQPGYPAHKWFTDDEKYWISIIPFMNFEGNRLTKLILYPIELGQAKPRSQRGRPMLAEPELATKIIEIIKKLSRPYGTEITLKDGVGVVEL